jgi:hypothetical protein
MEGNLLLRDLDPPVRRRPGIPVIDRVHILSVAVRNQGFDVLEFGKRGRVVRRSGEPVGRPTVCGPRFPFARLGLNCAAELPYGERDT